MFHDVRNRSKRSSQVLSFLVDCRGDEIDLNRRNRGGWSALMYASYIGKFDFLFIRFLNLLYSDGKVRYRLKIN